MVSKDWLQGYPESHDRTGRSVIYARISVSPEESVSIDRQVEAAQQYAAARGWKVVGTFEDEGVSATHNKPEDRAGWRALLAARERTTPSSSGRSTGSPAGSSTSCTPTRRSRRGARASSPSRSPST